MSRLGSSLHAQPSGERLFCVVTLASLTSRCETVFPLVKVIQNLPVLNTHQAPSRSESLSDGRKRRQVRGRPGTFSGRSSTAQRCARSILAVPILHPVERRELSVSSAFQTNIVFSACCVLIKAGRLALSPEEQFNSTLTQRAAEMVDAQGTLGRPEIMALLDIMRGLLNFAEEFPDEPPLCEQDVTDCIAELDFEGVGLGTPTEL